MATVLATTEELEALVERVVRKVMDARPAAPAELLTTEQAAALLQVEPQTVQRWARANPPRLRATRRGREYRFARSDVEACRAGEAANAVSSTLKSLGKG